MFTVSVGWYDAFYADKDYAAEADVVAGIVDRLCPDAETLLDVACGTGRHLEYLQSLFLCEGLDVSEEMLEIARVRVPAVRFFVGDMADFDLGRRFDVVTCLFSSIGYMTTIERLRAALAAMARHLGPRGVVIIEPWVLPEDWLDPGRNVVNQHENGDRLLVRVISSRREGSLSHLHIHYAVAEGCAIWTGDEHHVLRLFSKEEYLDAARSAGLSPEWIDGGLIGRGLVAAVAPKERKHQRVDRSR